jgi:dihydrolipoamide dehydrogenase
MYDLAIIGGGPGGYVAAICGAQQGLKVLLIEKNALGGTCLNRGCVPTKSLIYDSKLLKAAKTASILKGRENIEIDPVKMMGKKRQIVQNMVSGIETLLKSNDIQMVRGKGTLMGPGRVKVDLNDGLAKTYQAAHIILATGSKPATLPFIKIDGRIVQTTDEALDCEDIPEKVVIIGCGVIGIEMATIYLNLGCSVTIIELLDDILMTEDQDIRRIMGLLLKDKGVDVSFQDSAGRQHDLHADRMLLAAGRVPVLSGIDGNTLGLETHGPFVKVNSKFETSLPGVYAIGDLIGGMMLAHKASAEAEAVVANITGGHREVSARSIPRGIWGPSEIGAVGLSEDEARATGRSIKVGKFQFSDNGAGQAMGDLTGFTKIVGDAETGEILGVHIMGSHATDLIGEAVTVMAMEGTVEDLAEAIKPHPTLSETVMEAALDWNGLAIHRPKKK